MEGSFMDGGSFGELVVEVQKWVEVAVVLKS